ncbi:MAG: Oligopeptide ABC transporter, periplasmic oligopeptide-binding protein OppA [uncultured Solirubrobacteraceae bacterium]|uniref:Oligopeptide ABC transporter, periplasmic oligopeptide-binding protein OppA n=1 Tax=uncultured Solirubrobacteraceae bacterium TaxID=1162706 RepID=A0A6J4S0M4_9ACTN|nr:MAG: Oligopeptide ABC transporter, periplasmic oligopeptide-binding protein OppA [uncultured Solirubrobacteraceae bacterium]
MGRRMTRRTFVRGSAATALAVALPSCGGSPPAPPGTVRVAGGFFGFPSPFAYIAGPGYVQMSFLYDTLLCKDASGRLLPWLAQSFERSADGLTYTFALRERVRWHDGRPLTAQDVAFTFEYFAAQSLGPLLVAQPFGVKEARATAAHTVEIELRTPAVTFLHAVAGAVPIIPRHIWSTIRDPPQAQERAVLVGSGPYRLKSFSLGEGSALLEPNDDFFLGAPFVRRLELRPVDDELTALRAGEIDLASTPVEGVRPQALAPLRADDTYGIVEETGSWTFPLIFNLARGGAPADVRFRRACALAIDRRAIVQRLLGGAGAPGNPGFLPLGHPFAAAVEQYRFDPAAANRLLDDAGYRRAAGAGDAPRRGPDGAPLRLQLLAGNAPAPPVLDLLRADLKDVGVQLRPQTVDLPTLFGRTQRGADDSALTLYPGPGGTAPNADPDALRTFFSSRIEGRLQGAQGWHDAEFDRLAARQLVTADTDARRRLLARMQQIVARDVPALALYYPTVSHVFRRRAFDRWYVTPGGFAGGLPGVLNKHALVTGTRTGLRIRRA